MNPEHQQQADDPIRVLVATVAHRGDDARIAFRQIGALSSDGFHITYVAPEPVVPAVDVAVRIVVPRATGLRRLRSWWAAARVVRSLRGRIDLVLVHDLELVLPVRLARPRATLVWDVHEDVVASVSDRTWIPRPFRRPVALVTGGLERLARRGAELILAEHSYAERLGDWQVVPNSAVVPDTLPDAGSDTGLDRSRRIVYLGRISLGRGLAVMIELAELLGDDADVVLIGAADSDVVPILEAAVADGVLEWWGPMPNPEALTVVARSLVGLCLLQPLPNYLGSMPTKIHEYSAHGIPTVSTPLPLAAEALRASGTGVVVPFGDADAACAAVRTYLADPALAREQGRRAHAWVHEHHNWTVDGQVFTELLASLVTVRGCAGRHGGDQRHLRRRARSGR